MAGDSGAIGQAWYSVACYSGACRGCCATCAPSAQTIAGVGVTTFVSGSGAVWPTPVKLRHSYDLLVVGTAGA